MNRLMIVFMNLNIMAMSLFLVIALISKILKKKIPSRNMKVLWILFFVFLILPVPHDVEIPVTNDEGYVPAGPVYDETYIPPTTSTRIVSEVKTSTWPVIEMIYLIGLFLVFIRHITKYYGFKKLIKFATLNRSYGLKYPVYDCEGLNVPIVKGIISPKIYIPLNMSKMHAPYVLSHELDHIKKKDLLVKYMALVICWIHWYNPLVWLAFNHLEKHIEMSCDEAVTKNQSLDFKKGYMTSMIEMSLEKKNHHYGLAFKTYDVKDRLQNMMCGKLMSKQWQSLFNTLMLLLISVIVFNPLKSIMIQNPNDVSLNQVFEIITTKLSPSAETFNEVPYSSHWISPIENGYITYGFGKKHKAIDIAGEEGSEFYASRAGTVKAIETLEHSLMIKVDHGDGYESWYGSCKDALVGVGDTVNQGYAIGTIEFTGTGPHLHFSVLLNGEFVNPERHINR